MFKAYLTVIPKEGKDPNICANNRPILLLTIDMKIFTNILAFRLSPVLSDLIHTEQVCFMKGREAKDATTRAIHILYYSQKKD